MLLKLIGKIASKAGLVSKLLPMLLRLWAEGGLGKPAQAVYWFLAGKKAITGAVLLAVGTALDATCGSYPQWDWACYLARGVFWLGALLTSVGLVDGGVRSPWPDGTPKSERRP